MERGEERGIREGDGKKGIKGMDSRHSTDGRTEGQTDTFLIASPRWHSMQRGLAFYLFLFSTTPVCHILPLRH